MKRKSQAVVLLATLCLWSSDAWSTPLPPPSPPAPRPPGQDQIWQTVSPLSQGKILYRPTGSSPWTEWTQGSQLSAGHTEFKLEFFSDHRWTKYGQFTSKLRDGKLEFVVPRWTDKRLHDASFQPSLWTSRVLDLNLAAGNYQLNLGNQALGTLKVKP